MSGYSRTASRIPWWREPTKDQWYAYCAAWMGWTLDAGCFRLHRLSSHHGADRAGVRRAAHRRDRSLLGHTHHAPGRSDSLRLAGRPHGAPSAADDLHPLVLGLQLRRWILA